MKKVLATGLALAVICGIVSTVTIAAEQEESSQETAFLDEVVVTATRSEENITEIPAKIEVINKKDIELTAGDTLTDQLKKSSSVSVIQYPGALSGIGIRGFRPEYSGITKHSLILINGRPAGATNLAGILTNNLERIEVLKGPASSLYGAEAMGGVVNIITKKNTDDLTGNVELGYGSFNTNFEKIAVGGGISDSIFDFDAAFNRFDQDDNFTMGNGEDRAHTSYMTQDGSLRVGADLGDSWRLDVRGDLYQGRDIETPGDVYDGDTGNSQKDIDRYGIDMQAEGQLNSNNTLSITTYMTGEESEYSKPVSDVMTHYYDSETNWYGAQLKDTYSFGNHQLIGGLDYQYVEVETRRFSTSTGSRTAPYSPDNARTNYAAYLETVLHFMEDRLTVTAGGRYDYFEIETLDTPFLDGYTANSEDFTAFSPRVGANYLFDNGFRLHTTLGQAYVPPSASELSIYYEETADGITEVTKGNSDLDAETSTTWDGGIGYNAREIGFSVDVTYFYTEVDDGITSTTTGSNATGWVYSYENGLGSRIQGVETDVSFDIGAPLNWNRRVTLYFNATNIIEAEEQDSTGEYGDIHNVADYTYNYGVKYDDGMFDGKFNMRSVGPMRDTDWNTAGYPEIEYPSFTVADLVLGVNFKEHHRVALTVSNLFDEDYYEKKGYPLAGQAFYVSYKFSF